MSRFTNPTSDLSSFLLFDWLVGDLAESEQIEVDPTKMSPNFFYPWGM